MFRRLLFTTVLVLLVALVVSGPVLAAPPGYGRVHVVRRGETLSSIARLYGVSVWALAQANHLSNPNWIYVGQRLVIPGGGLPSPGPGPGPWPGPGPGPGPSPGPGPWPGPRPGPHRGRIYIVQRGDTLFGIAYRFGVSVWALARANGIYNPNLIYVGQRLVILGW